jgi:GNAT superfamily N-acetyltransferase
MAITGAEMTLASPEVFERAGLKAWPGLEIEWDGAWILRSANGYTKRANSLQCFDPVDNDDAAARLASGKAWFLTRGIKPVVRTTPLQSPALTAALDAEGWQTIDQSHLYALPLASHEADAEGRTTNLLDPFFLMTRLRALLSAMAVPAAGVLIFRDGEAVAAGLMAISDGIVVTGNVITDPLRRRQGLAAAMMRTGLAWAHANGAKIAALNVQADNEPAKALYARLGYAHQYDYAYRIPKDA